jgi:hypothetical protein
MTKITLDDVEYDTDTFNKEQLSWVGELQKNHSVSTNLTYQLSSLNVVKEILMNKLKGSFK